MTREEAIEVLKDWDGYFIGHSSDDVCDALEMAINALEQEPCSDAISRQAVNEIINDIRDCISVEGYLAIIERMMKLPPVNPQPKTGHWIIMPKDAYDSSSAPHIYCSKCKTEPFGDISYNYCPNCGARMER